MKVLALCSYPVEAAATRHRLVQFAKPLRQRGIELHVSSFLSSEAFRSFYSGSGAFWKIKEVVRGSVRRLFGVLKAGEYDALFVQREAMLFGPEIIEFLLTGVRGLPLVLDLDDATYVAYDSPTYGKIVRLLKFFGKTDRLIDGARVVVCGNRYIADYVESRGGRAIVLPTTVDEKIFKPIEKHPRKPVLGWIGTHSTFPLLEKMFPVIQDLAKSNEFRLRIIGSGRREIVLPGVDVETLDWSLEREPFDFADIDIGLYPLSVIDNAPAEWIAGKSGFKAIQYLAVGIPFVMTPVGVCATIGRHGVTHFNAESGSEWLDALRSLVSDIDLRRKMGSEGRKLFLSEYNLDANIDALTQVFLESRQ